MVDLAGGPLIFIALGFSLLTWLHFVRPRDGVPLLSLPGLFDGLQKDPGQYWWLLFMLASTLLPTLLHAMVGLFTLLLHYPRPLRRWVAAKLVRGAQSDVDGWKGASVYCGMITAAIWVPVLLAYHLLHLGQRAALNLANGQR